MTLFLLYAIGGLFTLLVNIWILERITSPLAIARNALLWPVFLPIVVYATIRYVIGGE